MSHPNGNHIPPEINTIRQITIPIPPAATDWMVAPGYLADTDTDDDHEITPAVVLMLKRAWEEDLHAKPNGQTTTDVAITETPQRPTTSTSRSPATSS